MARLTYGQREDMAKSSFAIPANKNSKNKAGKGAYPIPDLNHARNALARVAQYGTPAQKAKVRAAVRKHFPSINTRRKG